MGIRSVILPSVIALFSRWINSSTPENSSVLPASSQVSFPCQLEFLLYKTFTVKVDSFPDISADSPFVSASKAVSGKNVRTEWNACGVFSTSIQAFICSNSCVSPAKELIDLLWGDESSSNPENTLKITLHRARALLDLLRPSIGRRLIVYRDGGYVWSDALPLTLDIDRFDLLCQTPPDAENALGSYLEALKLYRGEFLANSPPKSGSFPLRLTFIICTSRPFCAPHRF